jgi:TRAP transporter 4TM/12TM fusion protein
MKEPVLENEIKVGAADVEADVLGQARSLTGSLSYLVSVVAVAMSLFHLYTAVFGVFVANFQRAAHLGFALVLVFLIYKPFQKSSTRSVPWYDWLLVLLSAASLGYLVYNADAISQRFSFIDPLSDVQMIVGVVTGLLLVEATRRITGNALTIIVIVALLYALYGHHLTGPLSHREFTPMWIIDQLFYTTGGVLGIPLGVSATFIAVFVLFGKFLENSGGGQFFINLAIAVMGKYRGGPAKTAILASTLLGTISGSAVANTVTTGAFTIPMMKKTGYKPEFAGAVEAVASSGGQIMPPLMGAGAFIIASYLGVPYLHVAWAALIPALLYYLCLYFQVDFRAQKRGLRGLDKSQIPPVKRVLRHGFLHFIPLVVIVWLLVQGTSPMRAGLFAILAVIVVALIMERRRFSLATLINSLDFGARGVVQTAVATAAAGIIIGVVTMTGIGLRFSGFILDLSGGNLLLTLLLTMVTSIILGMGLPTVAAYIVQVALTVPALIALGVPDMAAHLFIFYFAILSAITPPVALAAFAAASISGADPLRTSVQAMLLGIAAFVVPFMFVYGPSLLMIGEPLEIVRAVVTAFIGIYALAAAVEGYMVKQALWFERLILFASALLLVKASFITDVPGLIGIALVFVIQKWLRREDGAATAKPVS